MPRYGWKPEFNLEPPPKSKGWPPPPDMSTRKVLKRSQLAPTVSPGILRAWLMNSYEGEADEDSMPDGVGSANLGGGVRYYGLFKKGLLHGTGRLEWGNGCSFEGTFYCNRLLGRGVYSWSGGGSYTGQIYDGIPHGQGKIEGPGGFVYQGRWDHGRRRGPGRMVYGKVATHEGTWKNDRKDGDGKLVGRIEWLWDSKSKVDSILINSYVGQYKKGMRHGKGVFYYAAGKLHFGIISHDRYDPVSQSGFNIVEPLVSSITHLKEEDVGAAKHGILRAIMRYKTDLQDAFLFYCSLKEDNPPEKPSVKEEEDSQLTSPEGKGRKDKMTPRMRTSQVEGKSDKKENKEEKSKKKKAEIEEQEPPYEPAKETIPEPESPRRGTAGRSHGISNKQFWRLLQDALILQPGIGVADVDRMLPVNQLSWDSVSDIHSPTQQLILREVILALVQIALCKFDKEEISSEEKVEKLFASAFRSLGSLKPDSWFSKVESDLVRTILLETQSMLQRLFLELLLESETSDYTISLGSVIKHGQDRRPQYDVPPGALLELVLKELYYYQMKPDDNIFDSLYHNISYKEFEIILLIFSTLVCTLENKMVIPEASQYIIKKCQNGL
ncbi:hypothetical protein R1sor_007478 [Riccia sorocarpa]|uniref:Uncharacterized protein n=1 Tax=Riccia sorocarpa TaxID=122646 RepID=A0ABD3HQK0_9MARC